MKVLTPTRLRFGLVGIANTAVDFVGYLVLVTAGLPIFFANFLSTSAGMLLSFSLNRSFTFRAKEGDPRLQALLFFTITAIGLWAVQPVVIMLVGGAFPDLPLLVPKAAGIAVGLVWNYVLYSTVVFRRGAST
ncbi:GtrA family protein [Amycolatopsis aidingensis]|uniref:GtrA family protein n=1 Tax=Amycolatopsis aidingensis TaxID=2842453 RepID=UPI001C0BEB0B|nr:GtrA family protein [Amycolatopsis aidingensis]